MLFKDISVLGEDFSVARAMDVRTDGARIAGVGGSGSIGAAAVGERIIDGHGKLLMPAFYNAHTHAPMTLMRGYGENLPLSDWLEKIFSFEDRLTGEDCYRATQLAMAESFAHGVVSSSDQYFFCEDIVRAASESGAKMNASRGLSYFGDSLDLTGFRPYGESRKLFYDYHNTSDGRIRVDIGLHAEYTATPGLIEAVAGLSRETGAPVHAHVSETQGEHEECKKRNSGRTPVRVLADGGVFDNGGLAAHCVWIEEEDADILKEKGVMAVSCPVSNMKLASGIAHVPLMLSKGLGVALGTDGAASNNSLNFFEEIKMLSLSAKIRFGDPTLITPAQALFAATRAGALAQGRPDCGFVKEGFRADLIVIDLLSPSLGPVFELANNLVFSASSRDILMTVSDGRVVYESGAFPTVDVERAVAETTRARARILKEIPAGHS
ncbi:MAG: amidohydrolase [Clostridiales Family XIII bacterium]|nr:amidohydrolase [Clostridiales Family XIII bacterium]